MIALWLSLVVSYAGILMALGGPNWGALMLAVFMASATVIAASLARLACSCSLERALVAGVAGMSALHVALHLSSARSVNFNARIGENVTWIDGSPTAAGIWGMVYTESTIVLVTFAAYVLMRVTRKMFRWLMGAPAAE